MKKALLAVLILLVVGFLGLQAQDTIVIKVKVKMANLRAEPDLNSQVVKQVTAGNLLEARSRIGDWFEVVVTNEAGESISAFIHSSVVDVLSGEEKAPARKEPEKEPEAVRPSKATPQYEERPRVSYQDFPGGIKIFGGLASANIAFSRDPSAESGGESISDYQKARMGLSAGLGFEMGGRLGLEVDVFYMEKGVRFQGSSVDPTTGVGGTFDVKAKLVEISVPVLLKYKFLPNNTPYILGGGEVAYIMSNEATYKATDRSTGETYSGTEKLDTSGNLNKLDYGLVFGGGFETYALPIPLFVEVRYHFGLANLFKTDEDTPSGVEDSDWIRNRVLLITAGVKF